MIRAVAWNERAVAGIHGAREATELLARRGIHSVLITVRDSTALDEYLDLHPLIHLLRWPDELDGVQPLRPIIKFLKRQHGIRKWETAYVGDCDRHVEMAWKAKMFPLLVRTGRYRLTARNKYKPRSEPFLPPEHIVPSVQFVPGLIRRVNAALMSPPGDADAA